MCYEEGLWQAYLDHELSEAQSLEMKNHLKECSLCTGVLQELESGNEITGKTLTRYRTEMNKLRFSSQLAWDRFIGNQTIKTKKRGFWNMRKSVAALVAIGIIGSLAFTPVRSAAAQILQIFRVEKMAVVSLSMEDIQQIRNSITRGTASIDMKELGRIELSGKQEILQVNEEQVKSLAPAARFPSYLPPGFKTSGIKVSQPITASFNLNIAKINQVMKDMGGTKLLPTDLSGRTFGISIAQLISATFLNESDHSRIFFSQGESPQLDVPGDVDVAAIREAVLELPILPPNFKQQLGGIKDWQHTLVIPDVDGATQKVEVNGQEGIFIDQTQAGTTGGQVEVQFQNGTTVMTSNSMGQGTLIWHEGERVYTLTGALDLETALKIAGSLK